MAFNIVVGSYRLSMLSEVKVNTSVENLADTAVITLPASIYNKTIYIEDKIKEGDKVKIAFGYEKKHTTLPVEFEGYVESIVTDNGSIQINCEDELYNYRKDIADKEFKDVDLTTILNYVNTELGGFSLACDYSFKYDKFTIYNATGFDVLKKIQEETKANIYLVGKTLHIHPQYSQIDKKIIYDFALNIEKSELKYKDATKRKFMCVMEGVDAKGQVIRVEKGVTGGDKFTLKINGVSDKSTLEKRAEEELKIRSYTGYEGSITAWLIPFAKPTMIAEIRDEDYSYKTGTYYIVSVETTFSQNGGSRKVTLGKKIDTNG